MYCSNCGYDVEEGAAFCSFCGTKVDATEAVEAVATPVQAEEKKSGSKAFIFSIIGFVLVMVLNMVTVVFIMRWVLAEMNLLLAMPESMSQAQAQAFLMELSAICQSYGMIFLVMGVLHILPLVLGIVGVATANKEKKSGINSKKAKIFGIIATVLAGINFATLIIAAPICINLVNIVSYIAV